MHEPIRTKKQMYDLLANGALGNTVPLFPSIQQWESSEDYGKYDEWGIRVSVPGDPRMRLYVPRNEVASYVSRHFSAQDKFNISPMIDQWIVFKGEVFELDYPPFGWSLYATSQRGSWRESLRESGKTTLGLQAKLLLQHYCDPASYADIAELLRIYPSHVVEFSVCNRNVGNIPGRNCVIWECRLY